MNDVVNAEAKVTKAQAATMLGVDPRTIRRMIDREELTDLGNGFLLKEEVMQQADERRRGSTIELTALTVLKETNKQLQQQVLEYMKCITKPMEAMAEAQRKQTKALMKRTKQVEKTNLQMMQVIGDILMQKQERENSAMMAAERAKALNAVAGQVKEVIPILGSQILGKKGGKAFKVLKDFQAFAAGLGEEEKAALVLIGEAFKGKQKERFESILKAAGISVSEEAVKKEQENSEEKTEEQAEEKPPETERNTEGAHDGNAQEADE